MAVAVYCRVSSEDQAERGTIEIQKDFAAKYVNLYNLDVFDYYCDDGVTGTLPLEMRPEGKRLLEDAANKRFNTVIFHKLDRLGRKVRVILNAVHDLDEFDVSIKSMTEPFETETPTGKFLLTTLAGIAELDRDTILARMWSGAQLAAKQGRWLGGIVPYGYHVVDKHLVVSDEPIPGCRISEEDVVNIIFDMAAKQKASCRQIADYLNAMNIPTKYVIDGIKGKRLKNTANYWYPSRILSIITSTTYKGIHAYGKRATHKHSKLITRPVPPIVSERIWERANEAVKENRIESMRNTKREYLLRSLIRCALCGHAYVGASYQKGKPFYVCSGKNKYKYLASERCTASNIRVDWLDNVVWQRCLEFLENPEKIYEAKSNAPVPEEEKEVSELEILKEQMRGILDEKERLLDLYRKKIITEQDLSAQISKLYADEESLNKQLQIKKDSQPKATLKQSKNAVVTILKDFISNLKDVKPSELPFELKRQVIKMLVDKIVIDCKTAPDKFYPDINVAIIWRFDAENVNLNYINNFTVTGFERLLKSAVLGKTSLPARG